MYETFQLFLGYHRTYPTKQRTKKAHRYAQYFQNVCTGAKLGPQILSEMDRILEFMGQTEPQGQSGQGGDQIRKNVGN